MKEVDYSRVLQYYINLNNHTITPILLAGVEKLDITIPSQLQSALTYLLLAATHSNCRNHHTVSYLVSSIQVMDGIDSLHRSYSMRMSQNRTHT